MCGSVKARGLVQISIISSILFMALYTVAFSSLLLRYQNQLFNPNQFKVDQYKLVSSYFIIIYLPFHNILNIQEKLGSINNREEMQEKKTKQLKITIVGNSQVGKTAFLNSLQSLKPKNNDKNLNFDPRTINKFNILGDEYRLSIVDIKGSGKHLQKNNDDPEWKICTQKTNIAIIMFDVGNRITFDQIGKNWLKLVQQLIKPKSIVILGNKIDRQMPALTLKSIHHFCKNNDLELFFTYNENGSFKQGSMSSSSVKVNNLGSAQMHNKKIIQQIILRYESKQILQQLKSKKEQEVKKPGFMSKLFKLGTKQQQNENSKEKQKQKQYNVMRKLLEIKNIQNEIEIKYEQKLTKILNNVTSIFQKCEKFSKSENQNLKPGVETKMDNFEQINKKLQFINSLIQKLSKQLQKQDQAMKKLEESHERKSQQYQKEIKQINQIILRLEQKKQAQQKEIQRYKVENKWISQSKISLQKQISKNSSNSIIQDQNVDEIAKLKSDLSSKSQNQIALTKQIQKLQSLQVQSKKDLDSTKQQLSFYRTRITFQENIILSKASKPLLCSLSSILMKSKQNIKKVGTSEKLKLKKIYQSNLQNSNIHMYIEEKQSLLYTFQLESVVIIVYISEQIKRDRKGKTGTFILWDKKKEEIKEIQVNKNLQFWKYDPLSLVFGKREVVIKFWKYKHMLSLNEKRIQEDSLFLEKHNKLFEIFRQEKNEKCLYPIISIEVCTLFLE